MTDLWHWLQPFCIVPLGEEVWLVERSRPAAAVVRGERIRPAPGRMPRRVRNHRDAVHDDHWTWVEPDDVVVEEGVRCAGLVWWAGADRDGSSIERHALIRGHDPRTGEVVVSIDAGVGLVGEVVAVRHEVWISIQRRRLLRVARSEGMEVLAVSRDGSLRVVHAPNSVPVDLPEPPLVPRPVPSEIAKAVDEARREFRNIDRYWRDPRTGRTTPLAGGMTDSTVTIEGDWPDIAVVVTLRHPSRPGVLLRRRIALYNRIGELSGTWNEAIELMEDLDTEYLPELAEAVDGVLDF